MNDRPLNHEEFAALPDDAYVAIKEFCTSRDYKSVLPISRSSFLLLVKEAKMDPSKGKTAADKRRIAEAHRIAAPEPKRVLGSKRRIWRVGDIRGVLERLVVDAK